MINLVQMNDKNNIDKIREYYIKSKRGNYNLRIEIDDNYISFIILSVNEILNFEFFYKNHYSLSTFVKQLKINSLFYTNPESILILFDKINENGNLSIIINDDSCILLIKLLNSIEGEITNEIKLYKENINNCKENIDILYKALKLVMKRQSLEEKRIVQSLSEAMNDLNEKINKREVEFNDILKKKDNIINEMNEKIKIQDKNINDIINKRLEEIENKITIKLTNEIKKQNEIIKKQKDIIDKSIINQEKINKDCTDNFNLINNLEKKVDEIKIQSDNSNINNIINNFLDNNINEETENKELINNNKNEIDKIKKDIESINNQMKKCIITDKDINIKKIINESENINKMVKLELNNLIDSALKILEDNKIIKDLKDSINIVEKINAEILCIKIKKKFNIFENVEKDKIIKVIKKEKITDLQNLFERYERIQEFMNKFDEEYNVFNLINETEFFEAIIDSNLNEDKIREWMNLKLSE